MKHDNMIKSGLQNQKKKSDYNVYTNGAETQSGLWEHPDYRRSGLSQVRIIAGPDYRVMTVNTPHYKKFVSFYSQIFYLIKFCTYTYFGNLLVNVAKKRKCIFSLFDIIQSVYKGSYIKSPMKFKYMYLIFTPL
jgi:hypothetical protein